MAPGMRSRSGGIDRELDRVLKEARQISSEGHAYGILAKLVLVSSKIKLSTTGLTTSLQSWIQKIKATLEAIAKFLKAANYSVGVSVPFGLSISISFSVSESAPISPGDSLVRD